MASIINVLGITVEPSLNGLGLEDIIEEKDELKAKKILETYSSKGVLGEAYYVLDNFFSKHGFIKKENETPSALPRHYYIAPTAELVMLISTGSTRPFRWESYSPNIMLWFERMTTEKFATLKSLLETALPMNHVISEFDVTNPVKAHQLKTYFLDPTKYPVFSKGEPAPIIQLETKKK